jgi:type IV secretion system protein TrbL
MAPAAAKLAGSGARAATSAASSAKSAFQAGSAAAGGGAKGAMAGLGNVAKTGAQAAGRRWHPALPLPKATHGRSLPRWLEWRCCRWRRGCGIRSGCRRRGRIRRRTAQTQEQPAWAKRLHRRQQLTHAATTTAHTLRGGDGGSSGQGPSLRDSDS